MASAEVAAAENAQETRKVKQGKLTFYYGIEQGTQEWLDLRANRATCSNAKAVCEKGVKYAIEINRQHAARKTPNGNQYAERGHVLEDEVKERIQQTFETEDLELVSCSFITNDDYPHAGYSPDWLVVNKHTGKFVAPIEIKCFNDKTERFDKKTGTVKEFEKWKHKECCESVRNIPLENRMQFEMEMLMTETEELLVILYNPDAEEGVPQFKMHVYTPETRMYQECFTDEDGSEVVKANVIEIYQKRLIERLTEPLDKDEEGKV